MPMRTGVSYRKRGVWEISHMPSLRVYQGGTHTHDSAQKEAKCVTWSEQARCGGDPNRVWHEEDVKKKQRNTHSGLDVKKSRRSDKAEEESWSRGSTQPQGPRFLSPIIRANDVCHHPNTSKTSNKASGGC